MIIKHRVYIFSNKKNMTLNISHWEIGKLRNSQEFTPECIHEEENKIISDILQKVLNEEKWTPFRYPVDFSEYPEYYAAVPYPIHLELILKRLKHNYYRQTSVI